MSASPTQAEWVSALIRFGEMKKEQAVALGSKLACLPSPSNDASIYLTNEFLKKYVGVESPADRSRIMLAASRCPPPIDHGEDLSIDERVVPELTSTRAALRASLKEDYEAASAPPPSQTEETAAHASREEAAFVSTNPETLIYRKLRNGNARFYDVAGGYSTVTELADVEKTKNSEYFKACCAVYDAISSHRVRGDPNSKVASNDRSASVHPSGIQSDTTDGDFLVGVGPKVISEQAIKALTPAVETDKVDHKSDMYEPLFANSLVKAALVTRRNGVIDMVNSSADTVAIQAESSVGSPKGSPKLSDLVSSIVLLVPSGCILDLLEVKPRALVDMFFGAPYIAGFEKEFGGDARFLTRWVLLANKETLTFAIVHKDDTVGLANLRERWAKAHSDAHAHENEPADEEEEAQQVQDVFAEHMVDIYGTFLNEYELALDDCETVLDNIESNVVEKRGGKEMSAALHHLSRRAAAFERALELASRTLADASDFFDVSKPCSAAELRCGRLMERATSIQDRSIGLLNLVVSLSGFHTSDAFNVLTLISGALIPLGVCTGFYGMNWTVFPDLQNQYAYFIFTVGIISIFIIMIIYLKAKGL